MKKLAVSGNIAKKQSEVQETVNTAFAQRAFIHI